MRIIFDNSVNQTDISIQYSKDGDEFMIDVSTAGVEAWHSFGDLDELDEFLEKAVELRNKMARADDRTPLKLEQEGRS